MMTMEVLDVQNVHDALPSGIRLLRRSGVQSDSRNGPVIRTPWPVATVYQRPDERVIFWEKRDANPFFHLYEALWMLQGRKDIQPLSRYARQMLAYSDDGRTLHGAYGFRWREHFGYDQIRHVAKLINDSHETRRAVLQMWDAEVDGIGPGKDYPCNVVATFQVNPVTHALDLVVFNRSNDIIWGAYGANAVHFSVLLEYIAAMVGLFPGTYTQMSVNYHAYVQVLDNLGKLWEPTIELIPETPPNPYRDMKIRVQKLLSIPVPDWDEQMNAMMALLDEGLAPDPGEDPFLNMAGSVLHAHSVWRAEGLQAAWDVLDTLDSSIDWVLAAYEWLSRRKRQ
jgi:thymidylate synthase